MVWMNHYTSGRKTKGNKGQLSILKLAKFFAQHLSIILDAAQANKLEKQLFKQCEYEKRNDRETTMEKYEKLAA